MTKEDRQDWDQDVRRVAGDDKPRAFGQVAAPARIDGFGAAGGPVQTGPGPHRARGTLGRVHIGPVHIGPSALGRKTGGGDAGDLRADLIVSLILLGYFLQMKEHFAGIADRTCARSAREKDHL